MNGFIPPLPQHAFIAWCSAKHSDTFNFYLLSLIFKFASEHTIRKVQENEARLQLNRTCYTLVSAEDALLLGENMNIMKKNTTAPLDASKEVKLEANSEKSKYMPISRQYNAG
jgi:hypothetical protein